ncbi:MAG: SPOR domain-containing protein [Pseudomonadota bacterium]
MEEEYHESSAGRAPTGPERMRSVGQTLSTWLGAAAATAVLVALGSWFYHLGVRDAQQVPIIRASTQPVKIRPVDPGGEVTPHQTIDSYNAGTVQQAGTTETQLADPAPTLTQEDVAMADLRPEPKPETAPETQALAVQSATEELGIPEANDLVVEVTPEQQELAVQEPVQVPSAEPQATEVEPEEVTDVAVLTDDTVVEEVVPTPAEQVIAKPVSTGNPFAPDYSPQVIKRPPNLRVRMLAARASADTGATDLAKAAEASQIKVQLQASPSRDVVMNSWKKIRQDHADLLSQKALVVGVTQSGGVTYYRLRLGPFKDRAEATATCQALRGRGQDCIVSSGG